MPTPNVAELLVQQSREAERLRLRLLEIEHLVKTCKDIDELRREYDRLNQQK